MAKPFIPPNVVVPYTQRVHAASAVCVYCGKDFDFLYTGKKRTLCSLACKKARAAPQTKASANRPDAKKSPINRWEKVCPDCGKTFWTTNKPSICCAPCGFIRATRHAGEASKAKAFWPDIRAKWRHYSAARAAIGKAERFHAVEIYERDGWRCGICGGDVDPGLQWPDPGSSSLDHIQPLSRGGEHLRINVRCAHLGCNSARGAGQEEMMTKRSPPNGPVRPPGSTEPSPTRYP